ncbi:hypothetical protein [Salinibacterium sp. ZJ450]|uniref:hypothetical protein n=1 Tax=Salinibacterium sp. ZJ450 TaxID=2708338 RepID=UPI0014242D31|nr:hypothetical protein [Salinibacterium sp. ZJ450]
MEAYFPGHYLASADNDARWAARGHIAARIATLSQALLLVELTDNERWSPETELPTVVEALFAVRGIGEPVPEIAWDWPRPDIPLLLTEDQFLLYDRDLPDCEGVSVIATLGECGLVRSLRSLRQIDCGLL